MLSFRKRHRGGVTAIEYGLLAALIAVFALFFISLTGVNLKNIFEDLGNSLNSSVTSSVAAWNGGTSWSQTGSPANGITQWQSNNGIALQYASVGACGACSIPQIMIANTLTTPLNIPFGNYSLSLPSGDSIQYNGGSVNGIELWYGSASLMQNFCSKIGGTYTASDSNSKPDCSNIPSSVNYTLSGAESAMNFTPP